MDKIKVLFLAANPESTTRLKLDEEIREITSKIRASEYRDSVELISAWAVRPDDLLQYLNQYKPQIVHFSGHGSTSGDIILVDDYGQPKPVTSNALKALFATLKDNIQVVLLNACYTYSQAEAIVVNINYVIGMSTAIGDKAAITFAASFYRAIGFDRTVQEAFDQAKTALLLEGIPEENIPELLVRKGIEATSKVSEAVSVTDIDLLKQHRTIFDRPAFRSSCIDELFLREVSEAVDDTQTALNTGSLYSRSGKLLGTFPRKNEYKSSEFVQSFAGILNDLTLLKRQVETLRMDFRFNYFRSNPILADSDLTHLVIELAEQGNRDIIRKVIQQMDEIDATRNKILSRLNQLLEVSGEKSFTLLTLSSEKLRKGDSLYSLVASNHLVKYLD